MFSSLERRARLEQLQVQSSIGALASLVVLAIIAIFAFAAWLLRRQERRLAWLAAAAAAWLVLCLILVPLDFWPMPFAGAVAAAGAGFMILYRALVAAAAAEQESEELRKRIETTKANLLTSESARRSLEVANAVTHERERIMREIHDGIGSGLVAALASAERQGRQSTTAVVALKGALTDLRVAVDSLEEVEGDVAALLSSLRYRYETELRKAGIGIEWLVDEVPALNWLDAPSALHVLRILQECVSNVVGHSRATKVAFRCNLALHDGRPGLRIEVSDDGAGFDAAAAHMGHGRRNMGDRAAAIGAKLDVLSKPGEGTRTILWLPLVRNMG
jgi:signal transduction histidine kinase